MGIELPDDVHERIKQICAFELIPEPREDWEASTWIIAAIGDSFFHEHDYQHAMEVFIDVLRYPGGIGNVFVHLRLGQCCFE